MSTLRSHAARTFLTGRRVGFEGFGRRLAPSSSVRSKNWMISRQGSHLNMLRDVAAFDIAFRQPGQSGFVEDVEIEVLEIEVIKILCCRNRFWMRERVFVRNSRNSTNQGCSSALANGANAG